MLTFNIRIYTHACIYVTSYQCTCTARAKVTSEIEHQASKEAVSRRIASHLTEAIAKLTKSSSYKEPIAISSAHRELVRDCGTWQLYANNAIAFK